MQRSTGKRNSILLIFVMLLTMFMSMHALAEVNTTLNLDNNWVEGEVTFTSDYARDVYNFTVPKDGNVTIQMQGFSLFKGSYTLHDSSDNNLGYDRYSGASENSPVLKEHTWVLSAGTYSLKFSDGDVLYPYKGKYRIRASFSAIDCNETEPNDVFGTAMTLAEKKTINGLRTLTDEFDFYKFTLDKKKRIYINLTSFHDLRFTVYDSLYQALDEKNYGGSETAPNVLQYDKELDAGTYYIKISNNTNFGHTSSRGRYQLEWEEAPCEHTYADKTVKSTYTKKGYTLHTCSKCGESYKDNYTAKKTLKKVSLSKKYTAGKKTLKITWKKVSGATGYEVRYAAKSSMKGAKTLKVKSSKLTTTIKKLSRKKTYYVQVRAFRKEGSKTLTGKWSTKRVFKTK